MKPPIGETMFKSVKNDLDMLIHLHTKNKPLIDNRYPYKYQDYIRMTHRYHDLWENVTKLQKKWVT